MQGHAAACRNPAPSQLNPPPIRRATPHDVAGIHALVCELAAFEKLHHTVVSSPADFHTALFGDRPLLEALVADAPPPEPEAPLAARTPSPIGNGLAGTALFYPTFSTFTGKPGLWLEDVFVRPEHRGLGLGRAFLEHFLALARKRGCARAEWAVLHWNDHAVRLYQRLGAEVLPDWRLARINLP